MASAWHGRQNVASSGKDLGAVAGLIDIFKDGPAVNPVFDRQKLFGALLDGPHFDPVQCAAIFAGHDDVLGDVDQAGASDIPSRPFSTPYRKDLCGPRAWR